MHHRHSYSHSHCSIKHIPSCIETCTHTSHGHGHGHCAVKQAHSYIETCIHTYTHTCISSHSHGHGHGHGHCLSKLIHSYIETCSQKYLRRGWNPHSATAHIGIFPWCFHPDIPVCVIRNRFLSDATTLVWLCQVKR